MSVDQNISDKTIPCRLCDAKAHYELNILMLRQYQVSFFLCETCGLLQSEKPFWLTEAYSKAISSLDTGILRRNLTAMQVATVLIRFIGDKRGTFLDYGGGHGIFTRLMRDHGYDFRWQDQYAGNLYAQGFEYEDGTKLSGITAFEVLEHLENPRILFDRLLAELKPGFLLASTQLFHKSVDPQWDYFYPVTGQHIAFYQPQTMEYIAQQYGYTWVNFRYFQLFFRGSSFKPLLKILIPLSCMLYPVLSPLLRSNSYHLKDNQILSNNARH